MRIAIVSRVGPEYVSGATISTGILARAVADAGHDVILVNGGSMAYSGVVNVFAPTISPEVTTRWGQDLVRTSPDRKILRETTNELHGIFDAFRPDVINDVNGQWCFPEWAKVTTGYASASPGVSSVLSPLHKHYLADDDRRFHMASVWDMPWDHVIFNSQALHDAVANTHGKPLTPRTSVVYPPIDVARLANCTTVNKYIAGLNAPVVLLHSQFREGKGQLEMVKAWPLVLQWRPDAHLVLCAPTGLAAATVSPYFKAVMGLRAGLSLQNTIHPLELRYSDIPSALHAVALCGGVDVAPTLDFESFGCIVPEAQAAGVAVVAHDVGGFRESVRDHTNGLLVPSGDVDALGNAVGQLLVDGALRRRLVKQGQKSVKRFDTAHCLRETLRVYESVIRPHESTGLGHRSLGPVPGNQL